MKCFIFIILFCCQNLLATDQIPGVCKEGDLNLPEFALNIHQSLCQEIQSSNECKQLYKQIDMGGEKSSDFKLLCDDKYGAPDNDIGKFYLGCYIGMFNASFGDAGTLIGETAGAIVTDYQINSYCDAHAPESKRMLYKIHNLNNPSELSLSTPSDERLNAYSCSDVRGAIRWEHKILQTKLEYQKRTTYHDDSPGVLAKSEALLDQLGIRLKCYNSKKQAELLCRIGTYAITTAAIPESIATKIKLAGGIRATYALAADTNRIAKTVEATSSIGGTAAVAKRRLLRDQQINEIKNYVSTLDESPQGIEKRLEAAEKVLKRKLTPEEREWIKEAHKTYADTPYGKIGHKKLQAKIDAGNGRPATISPEQTRDLIESGILGTPGESSHVANTTVGQSVAISRSKGISNAVISKDRGDSVDVSFTDADGVSTLRTVAKKDLLPPIQTTTGHLVIGDKITRTASDGSIIEAKILEVNGDQIKISYQEKGKTFTTTISAKDFTAATPKNISPPSTIETPTAAITQKQKAVSYVIGEREEGKFSGKTGVGDYYGETDKGAGIKYDHNQDTIFFHQDEDGTVHFAVFDGIGGHGGGDVASGTAAKYMKEKLSRPHPPSMQEVVHDIPKAIEEKFKTTGKGSSNMGTTISGGTIKNGKFTVVNAGDSRTVILRKNAKGEYEVFRATQDHTTDEGVISNSCLIHEGSACVVTPVSGTIDLKPGDRIIVGTDGLWTGFDIKSVPLDKQTSNFNSVAIPWMNTHKLNNAETGKFLRDSIHQMSSKTLDDNIGFIVFDYLP